MSFPGWAFVFHSAPQLDQRRHDRHLNQHYRKPATTTEPRNTRDTRPIPPDQLGPASEREPPVQLSLWRAELLEWKRAWRQCVRHGGKVEAYTRLIAFPERIAAMRREMRDIATAWAEHEENGEDCSGVWTDLVALSLQVKCIGDEMVQHHSSADLEVLLEHLPGKIRRLKAARRTGDIASLRAVEFSLEENQQLLKETFFLYMDQI